jgi:hypothetical protein
LARSQIAGILGRLVLIQSVGKSHSSFTASVTALWKELAVKITVIGLGRN